MSAGWAGDREPPRSSPASSRLPAAPLLALPRSPFPQTPGGGRDHPRALQAEGLRDEAGHPAAGSRTPSPCSQPCPGFSGMGLAKAANHLRAEELPTFPCRTA